MDSSRRRFLAGVLALALILIPFSHGFEKPAAPMDEGSLLVYPELILKGQLPYRDFETFYGPANPYVLSAVYAIFGPSIHVERAVGLIYRLLILAAIFFLARRWGDPIALGCVAVSQLLLLSTGIAAYAWMGAMGCGLWALWMMSRPAAGLRCLFGGALSGCTLLYRVDLGLAVAAASLPLFLAMGRPEKWKYLAGGLMAALPMAWLALVIGPAELFNNLILFPVFHCNVARRLPIFSADNHVLYLLFAYVIATLLNLVAGVIAMRDRPRDCGPRLFLGLALFGLGLIHQAVQRIDGIHVISSAFVSLGLLPLGVLMLASRGRPIRFDCSRACLAGLAVIAALGIIVPELSAYFRQEFIASLAVKSDRQVFLQQNGRPFPFSGIEPAQHVGRVLTELERVSSPGQRLFVGPADLRRTNYADTYIYYLMRELRPATYFLEMNPLSANRPDSRLASDVASADWLLLNTAWDMWNEPNKSIEFGSDAPNLVILNQFNVCGKYGSYVLYRRKGLADKAAQESGRSGELF